LEKVCLTPHVEKHVAQQIFGHRLILDEAKDPAVDRGAMPGKPRLHCEPIATGDPGNQHFVG
jgi:hypothetical protein